VVFEKDGTLPRNFLCLSPPNRGAIAATREFIDLPDGLRRSATTSITGRLAPCRYDDYRRGERGRVAGRVREPGLRRKALSGSGHPQRSEPRQRFPLAPSDFPPLILKKPSSPTARRIPVPNPVFYFPYGSLFTSLHQITGIMARNFHATTPS
jgi:hypothetical protein